MIRPAKPQDVPAIIRMALQALNEEPYPYLVIDKAKVERTVKHVVSSAQHFSWVAEVGGEVRGVVGAVVDDCMFYERKQATVVQFYAKEAPGEGVKLIREFLRWARSRPAIKMIVFTLEGGADPRIGLMLKRMGLSTALPIYMETR